MPANPDAVTTISEAIAEVAPEVEFATLDPSRPLRDEADLDSLDMLDLLSRIERALGVTIPPGARAEAASLDELATLLERLRATLAIGQSNEGDPCSRP